MARPSTDARMRAHFLQLDATYEHLLLFRQHVKKITKLAKQYGQLAQEASNVSKQLSQCLAEIPVHSGCKPDESLALFGSAVAKLDNDRFAVARQLEPFFDGIIKAYMPDEEMRAAGELHRRVSQTMNDYDAAHRKHAQERAKHDGNELQELEIKFDSLYQLHKKRVMKSLVFGSFDVAERMSSFVFLMTNYVTQGFNSMLELEPTVNLLMGKLEKSRLNYEDINQMSRRSHNSMIFEDPVLEKQGYLFRKHKNGNWKLNWVVLRESSFLVYRKWKNFQPLLSLDLTLATVKPSVDMGAHKLEVIYKLEVISPNDRVELRCLTEADHKAWLQVFEEAIQFSLRDAKNDDAVLANDIALLHEVPGNDKCADCGAEKPEWISLNLGIIICLECSGIHRSLGTHVSKVRSLCLDRLPRSQLRIIELIGNDTANAFWESALNNNSGKIKPDTDRIIKTQFITAKYVEKVFTTPTTMTKDELEEALFESVQSTDVASISRYIQMGANVERVYYGKPLLHYAVMLGSTSCTEFLLQNDCMPNSEDENGFSALDQATMLNHQNCIAILQGRGGEHGSNSNSGATLPDGNQACVKIRPKMSAEDITPAEAKERHLSAASDMKEAVSRLLNPLPAGPPKAKPNRLPPLPPLAARAQQSSVPAAISDKARYVKVERVIEKSAPQSPPPQRRQERKASRSFSTNFSQVIQQPQLSGSPPGSGGPPLSPRSVAAAMAATPSSSVGQATSDDMDFGVSYASFKPPKPSRDPPTIPGAGHTSPRGMTSLDRLAALISPRGRPDRDEKIVDVDTSKAKWTKPPIPDAIFKLLDAQDGSGDPPIGSTDEQAKKGGVSDAKWTKKSELPEDILRKLASEPETQQRQLVESTLSPTGTRRGVAALSASSPNLLAIGPLRQGTPSKPMPTPQKPLPSPQPQQRTTKPEAKALPPIPKTVSEPPAVVAVPEAAALRPVTSGAAAAAKLRPRGQRPGRAMRGRGRGTPRGAPNGMSAQRGRGSAPTPRGGRGMSRPASPPVPQQPVEEESSESEDDYGSLPPLELPLLE